jgi:hypothetical protein
VSKVIWTFKIDNRPIPRLLRVPWRGGSHTVVTKDIKRQRREGKKALRERDW